MTFLGQNMLRVSVAEPEGLHFLLTALRATIIHLFPIVEYGCVVWEPHLKRDEILLETVQHFAVKVATKNWDTSPSPLTSNLNLPPLSTCRTLSWFEHCKFLHGYLYCPPDFFSTWNSLPREIVLLDSLSLFKSSLKLHLYT